jgi:hypothetical protein
MKFLASKTTPLSVSQVVDRPKHTLARKRESGWHMFAAL